MFFTFVLMVLMCLAKSSYSEDNLQTQNLDYDNRQRRTNFNESNDIVEDNLAVRHVDLDDEVVPLPLLVFLQKIRQIQRAKQTHVKTPRLGRTIDFDIENDQMKQSPGARLNKKNMPFKPRLGKRACICDDY